MILLWIEKKIKVVIKLYNYVTKNTKIQPTKIICVLLIIIIGLIHNYVSNLTGTKD